METLFELKSLRVNSGLKGKKVAFVEVVANGKRKMFTEIGHKNSVETICDLIQKITGVKFDLISHSLKKDDGNVTFQLKGEDTKVSVFSMKDEFESPLAVFASNLLDGINNVINLGKDEEISNQAA